MGVAGVVRRNRSGNYERRVAPEVRETEDLRAGAGREMLRERLRIGPQPRQGPALHDHELEGPPKRQKRHRRHLPEERLETGVENRCREATTEALVALPQPDHLVATEQKTRGQYDPHSAGVEAFSLNGLGHMRQ